MSERKRTVQTRTTPTRRPSSVRNGRYSLTILYEDDELIAVDKPCGLPTISPEGSRTRSLYDLVTKHIQRRNPKGRAALVHRLDKETSGVIVFAKNTRTKTELMSHWNEAVDERGYIALVEGTMPAQSGVLDTYLSEIDPYRVHQVPAGSRGCLRAITKYTVLSTGGGFSLLELRLETGRRHQIRVQLASAGCPVAGDERYGAKRDPLGRLGLHAAVISIARRQGEEAIRVESPQPPDFAAALKASGEPRRATAPRSEPRESRDPRPPAASPDRTRAWPGGGPASRGYRSGSASKKSSSSYSTRNKRKP